MKYRNTITVALVSLAIFFAFAVAGGICLGAGFGEYAKNSDMINNFSGFVEYVEEYADVFDDNDFSISAQRSEAHYVRELDAELTSIVIDASGGAVTVDVGATEEFRVDFDGNVKSGSYDVFDEYTQPVVSGDVVVDYADYYAHSGIIEARLKGDTLHISFDSALGVSIKPGFVNIGGNNSRISVTLPASYNGSLEIKNCVEDTVLRGCKLDSLTLESAAGEILANGNINMLVISNLAGEVDAEGAIRGIDFSNIAGEISVNSTVALENDSVIENIAGEVEIDLPYGSTLNVERDNVLGIVDVDSSITGAADAAVLRVSDVLGEVIIEIFD